MPSAVLMPASDPCKPLGNSAMTSKALIGLTLSAVLTAGCGINPRALREDCDWAEPIRPSSKDVLSEGTLSQIVAHNEIGARLCGWRP